MIQRPEYLDTLIRFKEKDLIKVITGIRRCSNQHCLIYTVIT